ncbi:hypothetical protein LINPERHAP2_LOCUS35012, partial [Linum perenne]
MILLSTMSGRQPRFRTLDATGILAYGVQVRLQHPPSILGQLLQSILSQILRLVEIF